MNWIDTVFARTKLSKNFSTFYMKIWAVSLLFLLLSFFLRCRCYSFPLEMFNMRVVCLCSLMLVLLSILGRRSFSLGHFLLQCFLVDRLLFQVAHKHSLSLAKYTNTINMDGWMYAVGFICFCSMQNFFSCFNANYTNCSSTLSKNEREFKTGWMNDSERIAAVDKK